VSWRIRGTYFESCNCDAICPCRRTDGTPGGRSTHGICLGVLSWVIAEGSADGVDLSGLPTLGIFLGKGASAAGTITGVNAQERMVRVYLDAVFDGEKEIFLPPERITLDQ
jgi:hypothetical protein